MTMVYRPTMSGNGRIVETAQWNALMKRFRGDGVLKDDYGLTSLQVSVDGSGGMQVTVAPGEALMLGGLWTLDAAETLVIEAADGTYDRIDVVVARFDRVTETASLAVLKGTPAATPVAETPTQNAAVWELALAEVRVRAGVTAIEASDVTDVRVVSSLPAGMPLQVSPGDIDPQGNGSGLAADTVDGRHATEFVRSDEIVAGFTASDDGWYTITTGAGIHYGRFVITEHNNNRHNIVIFDAAWAYSGNNNWPVTLREVMHTRYNLQTVRGVRLLYDVNNAIFGTAKLQVFLEGGQSYNIYQLIPLAEADTGYWQKWDEQSSPVHEDAPDGYAVQRAIAVGNGSWRLARALTGSGASIGYLNYQDMQQLFPTGLNGHNPAEMDDNDASTKFLGNSAAVVMQASPNAYVDKIKILGNGTASSQTGVITVQTAPDANGNWTTQGTLSLVYDSAQSWYELQFAQPTLLQFIQLTSNAYAMASEVRVSIAATLIVRGVPTGSAVQAVASDGTVLESVQNTAWTNDTPVMLSTDVASIDTIKITRPDGSTNWLQYPAWAIDGGALSNGDVLALYDES